MPRFETLTWQPDPNAYGPRRARRAFSYKALIPEYPGAHAAPAPPAFATVLLT